MPHANAAPHAALQVEWKLTREKNRPNLLKWAREASPAAVEDASTKAFEVLSAQGGSEPPLDVVKRAMAEMTVIKASMRAAGICIFLVCVSLGLLGDALR